MKDTNRCIQAGNLSGGKWDKMHEISRRYYSTGGYHLLSILVEVEIQKLRLLKIFINAESQGSMKNMHLLCGAKG